MKKFYLLLFVTLFVSINLYSQQNDIRLFSGVNNGYLSPNLHSNGDMLYMQADNKIFAYNTFNNTKSVIKFPSEDSVITFHNEKMYMYQNLTFVITRVRGYKRNGMRIYQIEGDEIKNSYLEDSFWLDTMVMAKNYLYFSGRNVRQNVIVPFDLKLKEFKSEIAMVQHQMHPVGDSLFIVKQNSANDILGLNADGDSWIIASNVYVNKFTANYNGYLYYSTPYDGIYKSNGKKGSIIQVAKLNNTWKYTRIKAFDHGVVIYNKTGMEFIAKGATNPLKIAYDSLHYRGEPYMLDDNRLVVPYDDEFHILNTDKKAITEKFVAKESYVSGMTSNRGDNEVYAAVSAFYQGNYEQNIYGLDANGNLAIYNSTPISFDTMGNITGIEQIDGRIFYLTEKGAKFNLNSLGENTEIYIKDVNVESFNDRNGNGIKDQGEGTFKNLVIRDTTTKYNYLLTAGKGLIDNFSGKKTVMAIAQTNWKYTTDSVFDLDITKFSKDTIIYVGLKSIHSVTSIEGATINDRIRCGSNASIHHIVINTGTQLVYSSVSVNYDSLLTINSFSFDNTPDSIKPYELFWKLENVNVMGKKKIKYFFKVPGEDFSGQILDFIVTYEGIDSFNKKITVVDTIKYTINCSYDPNDKTVWPNREALDNQTLFNESLTYRIRFQNTGTDTAYKVVVSDTLSSLLDWSTFRVLDESHPLRVKRFDDGTVNFIFDNIMLPDSNVDEPRSHGYVYYRINPKSGLKEYSEILNTAHIFFDNNRSIMTNTTRNLMVSKLTLSDGENIKGFMPLEVYPNPTNSMITIELKDKDAASIELYGVNGALQLQKTVMDSKNQLDISGLPNGLYLLRVQQNGNIYQVKVSKY